MTTMNSPSIQIRRSAASPDIKPAQREGILRDHIAAVRRRVNRQHGRLVSAIRFAQDDSRVVRDALISLDRLTVLIQHAPISDVGAELAEIWLNQIHKALLRFRPR
jgi:hypothetical protein